MSEVERVLKNWIAQAMSPVGTFPDDVDRAKWVADNFTNWWRVAVGKTLADAEGAANSVARLHDELGMSRRDELQDELLDVTEQLIDSLAELRNLLSI